MNAIDNAPSETIANILAGHKIMGMSDTYINRDPSMVADACNAIERHYLAHDRRNWPANVRAPRLGWPVAIFSNQDQEIAEPEK